jgi:hypothetical protein
VFEHLQVKKPAYGCPSAADDECGSRQFSAGNGEMLYSTSGCVDEELEDLGAGEYPKQTIHFVFVLDHSLDSLWELNFLSMIME